MSDYSLAPYSAVAPLDDGMVVAAGTWYGVARGTEAMRLRDQLCRADHLSLADDEVGPIVSKLLDQRVLVPECGQAHPSYRVAAAAEARVSPAKLAAEADRQAGLKAVAVLGPGRLADLITGVLAEDLAGHEVPVRRSTEIGDCRPAELAVLVAGQAATDEQLLAFNHSQWDAAAPWLLVLDRAASPLLVGPLFVPTATACLECHWARRSAGVDHPAEYEALLRTGRYAELAGWHRQMAACMAAALALGWLLTADPWLAGASYELSLAEGPLIRRHDHPPVAGCPGCQAGVRQAGVGQEAEDDR